MEHGRSGSRLGRLLANIAGWFGRSRQFAGTQTELTSRVAPLLAPGLPPNMWLDAGRLQASAQVAVASTDAETESPASALLWSQAQSIGETRAFDDTADLTASPLDGTSLVDDASVDLVSDLDVEATDEDAADAVIETAQIVTVASPNLLARQLRGVSRLNRPRRSPGRPVGQRSGSSARKAATKGRRQPQAWILARNARACAA